ncbi:PEPxxWA-CTERM sorting domain-containing protein [Phenylobacterium sp.]|uniref:PEPxxWA-CTERM sorting domain-containing protein n=1 Tax=Phenylobacterium sp. TaxID=1871053 RepID=UPI002B7D331A|nr:PEPxxWA-CTERM sorting domain-containing protein [Phenylobacterium sp.]HLZ76448.1 PEPxxWA-CTERM sorting domain-containing protein [Phenylobacterium sp.]
MIRETPRQTPRLRAATFAAATLAAAALSAGAAQAAQVFSDNFNTENGGAAANPYTNFANWTVSGGEFSVVEGARCEGGSGGCVGLDGRGGGPVGNEFHTTDSFNYLAGAVVTLTFDISGSHADCGKCDADDMYETGFLFGVEPTTITNVTFDNASFGTLHETTGIDLFGNGFAVPRNDPWTAHTISFTATQAGSVQIDLRSYSVDGIGPLLDNVALDVTGGSVPEPASWALMILGFGGAGAVLRRRRTALAA